MKRNSGFTLIELLVVIAIIGILSSVVLASLNTARGKGADAAVKSNLANARAQAELFYDENGTYAGICTSGTANGIYPIVNAAAASSADTSLSPNAIGNLANSTCNATATGWAAEIPLRGTTGTMWCVDSSGASKSQTGTGLSSATDVTCL